MEVNKILTADLLDIIFEGRNKEYGAYYLRKTYNERVKRALIITASIAGAILLISFLNQTLGDRGDSKVKINEMTLQDVKQEEKEPPPPPPYPLNCKGPGAAYAGFKFFDLLYVGLSSYHI